MVGKSSGYRHGLIVGVICGLALGFIVGSIANAEPIDQSRHSIVDHAPFDRLSGHGEAAAVLDLYSPGELDTMWQHMSGVYGAIYTAAGDPPHAMAMQARSKSYPVTFKGSVLGIYTSDAEGVLRFNTIGYGPVGIGGPTGPPPPVVTCEQDWLIRYNTQFRARYSRNLNLREMVYMEFVMSIMGHPWVCASVGRTQ